MPFWDVIISEIFRLSSLSIVEAALITANFKASSEPQKEKLDESLYTPEQLLIIKEALEKKRVPKKIGQIVYLKNWDEYPFPEWNYLLTLYSQFDNHLPFPGSLSEQPAKAIEAITLIKNLVFERDQKELKKKHGNKK